MKLTLTILILACSGGLNLAQQQEDLHEFIPIPRNNITVDPTVIPIPRAGVWSSYSLNPYYTPVITVKSTNYPRQYPAGEDDNTMLYAPSGYVIDVNCKEFVVEATSDCSKDGMWVSPTGRTDFGDATIGCGQGTFSVSSTTNRLAFRFVSKSPQTYNPFNPFRFSCTVSIRRAPSPTTTAAPVTTTAAPVTTTTTAAPKTTTAAPKTTTAAPASTSCTCGTRNEQPRIVGGTYANVNEFPWRCLLYVPEMGPYCGATVIDEEWIMTAAHCTKPLNSTTRAKLQVDCGEHDMSTTSESDNQMIYVDAIKQHPLYSTPDQNNDISLLHLSKPLKLGKEVSPVCLPWKQQGNQCTDSGTSVVASGWGTTQWQGNGNSIILKKVELPCMNSEQCRKYYGNSITNNMICTLKNGEDTCQGDSGGSIDYKDPNTNSYYAIGVVSWGDECAKAGAPGVYTNVVNYLDWIKATTGKTFCGQ